MEGREGAFSREGVWGRLFRGGFVDGMGGSAAVGGSARGRVRTGRDMFLVRVYPRNVVQCL